MSTIISNSFEYTGQKMFQKGIERGLQKGKIEGRKEGRTETTKEFVLNMLKVGMSIEQISEITSLPIEQIRFVSKGNEWDFPEK